MERQVKGIWIPIEIWLDRSLSWKEKILLMEIDSFTSQGMDCFFSDEYIAEMLDVHPTNANKVLSSLIKKGYVIKTKYDGRQRFVQSRLGEMTKADLAKTPSQTCQNDQHNNIDLINKDNNDSLSIRRTRFVKPTKEEVEAYCREKGYTHVNAKAFISHYDSNGWMVGKNKMSLWRSAVSGWEIREVEREQKTPSYNRPQAQPRKSVLQHNREVAERLFARRKEAMADEQ